MTVADVLGFTVVFLGIVLLVSAADKWFTNRRRH